MPPGDVGGVAALHKLLVVGADGALHGLFLALRVASKCFPCLCVELLLLLRVLHCKIKLQFCMEQSNILKSAGKASLKAKSTFSPKHPIKAFPLAFPEDDAMQTAAKPGFTQGSNFKMESANKSSYVPGSFDEEGTYGRRSLLGLPREQSHSGSPSVKFVGPEEIGIHMLRSNQSASPQAIETDPISPNVDRTSLQSGFEGQLPPPHEDHKFDPSNESAEGSNNEDSEVL